jgi:HEPN domain-containing protein
MNKIFTEHASPALSQEINKIVSIILPERIYLLSVIHQKKEIQSIFVEDVAEEHSIEAMNLLVLTGESEKKSNDELQDIIENRLGIQIPTTAFVMQAAQFSQWLKKEHPFALKVVQNARLYFDAGRIPLNVPDINNELAAKEILREDLEQKIKKALEFLAGAELFIVRTQFEMAAFHLHQATEQIYTGIIRFKTGFQVQTHNLDKLYRYSKYLLPGLKDVFPRGIENESKLFQCLQKAYLGSRYNADYSIKYEMVSLLFERVNKLLILCQGIMRTRLITA